MSLHRFTAKNFRCLKSVELELSDDWNVVFGANAAGKTSLLEAIAYLGRGRSFRSAGTDKLIRHGEQEFVLFGETTASPRKRSLGVRNGRLGLDAHVDGAAAAGVAALAEALPLQIIDPEVHALVAAGPEHRRKHLDWVAFHVEHGYLEAWRQFRRALKQRNAALRSAQGVTPWTQELAETGERLDRLRRSALAKAEPQLIDHAQALLGTSVRFEYLPGWPAEESLLEALVRSRARDSQLAGTQMGPHRADVRIVVDERQARKLVSRGQQKLLACSMVLAAAATVQQALDLRLLLLLDDPSAELDPAAIERLVAAVAALGSQVILTGLAVDAVELPSSAAVFHVEHGEVRRTP